MSYTYLNHVDAEFLAEEEQVGEEADRMLKDLFHNRIATKSRAIQGEDLRYVVVENGDRPEIIEEEGVWETGDYTVDQDNRYELIYHVERKVEKEEISAAEAAEHFGTAEI